MKRSFLQGLGLEDDAINRIMEENGRDIEREKAAGEAAKEESGALKKQLSEAEQKLSAASSEGSAANEAAKKLQSEFDAYKKEAEQKYAAKEQELTEFKADVQTKELLSSKQAALVGQLEADGANPKLVKLLAKEFDLDAIQLEDGKIKDWSTLFEPVKTAYADVFGAPEERGLAPANPPQPTPPGAKDPFLEGFNSN